jgi:MFS family permease
VKLELGLSDFQTSLVQGLAVSIPVALLAIPLGRLTDRSNRVRLLIFMAATWTAGMALTALAQGFAGLFAARMFANIGAILAVPIVISIASDLSRPEQRGRALLPLSLGKIAGQAAAFALGGWLFGLLTANPALAGGVTAWRGVHFVLALLGAALILPLLLLKEPARCELDEPAGLAFHGATAAIWSRRALLVPLFVGQVTVVMADVAALNWAPTVLQRDYGLKPDNFAGWMGLVMLLSGIFGSLIGGFAADVGQKSRLPRGILVGAVAAAALSIPGAFFPLMPGVAGFALLLGLLMLCGNVTGLVTATAIAVLVPNEIRGVCLGAFMVVGAVIGFGVAPTMTTMISDLLGGESQLRYALAIVMAMTSLIAATGFARAMRGRA